jgi:pyruvate formate lyase activating enzyme
MTENNATGFVHSFQSLGTVDGPGVRFVVFLSGCNLRCGCCHNPDTWEMKAGKEYTAEDILRRVVRYREYYGRDGGITVSGGEPLLQAEFVRELFSLCKQNGINTCLDTSGSIINERVLALLEVCDRVLLDIKYTNDADYRKYVGCGIDTPLRFLDLLSKKDIPTTVRQVIIPTLNDNEDNILLLKETVNAHPNVDKVELLPFRKICKVKYDKLGIEFPFEHLPEPSPSAMKALSDIL